MLVFIDESGDTGRKVGAGSSRYFVVVLVAFSEPRAAEACDKRIVSLRAELGLPANYEFKFSRMRRAHRLAFLQAVVPYAFFYFAIVVDKERLNTLGEQLPAQEPFYEFACKLVLESAVAQLNNAMVIVDGEGPQAYKRRLQTYLRRQLVGLVRTVKLQDSRRNNLLQLADVLAGAVHRSYRHKTDRNEYRPIMASKELHVQKWP